MSTILVVDTAGDSDPALASALRAAGWQVAETDRPDRARHASADAILLSTDAARLGPALKEVLAAREATGAPVALAVSLDRSGWDRTFGAPEALGVDALFDKPVDAAAVVRRLDGIMAARRQARGPRAAGMSVILDRAVANEEAAAAFYRQAASRVADPATRDALEGLMRDEGEHKRLIEEFRSGARPLPEGVSSAGSLVETFGTPEFSADMTPADAFLLAARKEKLAVEFYENWAKLYPAGPERDLLLSLAEVERRHKAKVESMFTNASFPEEW